MSVRSVPSLSLLQAPSWGQGAPKPTDTTQKGLPEGLLCDSQASVCGYLQSSGMSLLDHMFLVLPYVSLVTLFLHPQG